MFPAIFEYQKPREVREAVQLLKELPNAKLLAGGHSLIPSLKLRLAQPSHLIDLGGIPHLKAIAMQGDRLVIGAMATHWMVESSPIVKTVLPYLSAAAGIIADPQVRNRGTIGGSIVNADPAADYPANVLALNAELVCVGPAGRRVVEASDWFTGLMTTAIDDDEILTEVRIPVLPSRTSAVYLKLPHPASRFAVVGVAAIASFAANMQCVDVRIGITGVGSCARRAVAVERQLLSQKWDPWLIDEACTAASDGLEIGEDMLLSVADKEQLCRAYTRRALLRSAELAMAGSFQSA